MAKLHADNKVDVIIYAVEKSLDSYKFNLLQSKQMFISQLKNNSLGTRTIDEGSLDEKSGMNFSEYVAILSGNTDLLEKARLEKKVAALESERKSFARSKGASERTLAEIQSEIAGYTDKAAHMTRDWSDFNARVERDREGHPVNAIRLDGVASADVKVIAARLAHIAETTNTHGEHYKIGELCGFRLLVKTDESNKEGVAVRQNRFFIEGEGCIKYTYNNGHIAQDPKLAVGYFLHALEKKPAHIEKYRSDSEQLAKEVLVLQQIVAVEWRKEDELRDIKTELAALDRRIQLSLTPIQQGDEGEPDGLDESEDLDGFDDLAEKQRYEPWLAHEPTAAPTLTRVSEPPSPLSSPLTHENGPEPRYHDSPAIPDRLKDYKDALGDRLIIATVPPPEPEPDSDPEPRHRWMRM
ncbi:MAG: hypothetical protein LBR57_04620 [Alistipes sp.]|nr:hypothetical protein [Alistipes sp.]